MHRTSVAMDREWNELVASPGAVLALDRWRSIDPVIVQFADLSELVAIRSDHGRAQPVFLVLAREARAGDRIATRVLLQALLPRVIRLALEFAPRYPEALDELLSLAWDRIARYPTHRLGSVGANVLRDIRKAFLRDHASCGALPPALTYGPVDTAEAVALGRVCALDELDAARRAGAITDLAFSILVRSRLDDFPLNVVAAEHRRSCHAVVQIRTRAETRMREVLEGRIAA